MAAVTSTQAFYDEQRWKQIDYRKPHPTLHTGPRPVMTRYKERRKDFDPVKGLKGTFSQKVGHSFLVLLAKDPHTTKDKDALRVVSLLNDLMLAFGITDHKGKFYDRLTGNFDNLMKNHKVTNYHLYNQILDRAYSEASSIANEENSKIRNLIEASLITRQEDSKVGDLSTHIKWHELPDINHQYEMAMELIEKNIASV